MLNLKEEIFTIIKQQDFIILPMFGAFQADYTKPYINADGEIVESTRKQVFIPQFKKDLDSKLLNILVSKSSLPISLISGELENFISEINNSIKREKHFTWTNLGLFFFNDKNEVEFIESIANKEEVKLIITKPLVEETKEIDTELARNKESSEITRESSLSDFEGQSTRINYYKLALYVVPFLLLISGLIWTVFLKPNDKVSLKRGILTEIDSLEIAKQKIDNQEIIENFPKLENKTIAEKTKPEEETSKPSREVERREVKIGNNKIETKLKITIGTYKSRENVDNLTTYLAENGIPTKVRKERNYYLVYVNATNREQAERFSAKIMDLTGEQPIINN